MAASSYYGVLWGKLIRDLREQSGLSQRQFCERYGINRMTFRTIKKGAGHSYIDLIEHILAGLGYALVPVKKEGAETVSIPSGPDGKSRLAARRLLQMHCN